MISLRKTLWAAAIAALATPASAGVITVGGGLSDWGIQVHDSTNTGWGDIGHPSPHSTTGPSPNGGWTGTTNGASTSGFKFDYHVEDTNDGSNSYQVGPQYGGQNYDAEFLGAGFDDGRLVIAILSGQRPDNSFAEYSPGDIRITTSSGIFGVEVGGGKGGGSGTAISRGDLGTTYDIKNNGLTDGVKMSDGTAYGTFALPGFIANALQTAGSLWETVAANWISNSPITPNVPVQFSGGTRIDDSSTPIEYSFSRDSISSKHSVIELAIPLSLFNGATITSIQWAPSCGNDFVRVDVTEQAPPTAPEPSTLALMGLGGFGMAFRRWRRKSSV